MVETFVIIASKTDNAQRAKKYLLELYPESLINKNPEHGETIVVIGGDGFMLRTLKELMNMNTPLFGLNLGHLGFLMNPWNEKKLIDRINNAVSVHLNPLKMTATDKDGKIIVTHAFNEVTIFRNGSQSAQLSVRTNDEIELEDLRGDGIIIASPAGSPAYNYSARGPILPIGSGLLALTPINPFKPRAWRGAVLNNYANINITVHKHEYRPVTAYADTTEVPNVISVEISEDPNVSATIMFDPNHDIRSRIIRQQFEH